jgi:hypothetical protein
MFSLSLEEIYTLSKRQETLDRSWTELLKYMQENPEDKNIENYGQKISAKIYIREKYGRYNFINSIISEDLRMFGTSLAVLDKNLKIEKEFTEKILLIFPELSNNIKNIFESGIFNETYYKNFYRLDGLQKLVMPNSYMPFLKTFVESSISSPSFLDDSLEMFVIVFVQRNSLIRLNEIILDNEFLLNESDYSGAYKLLTFLNNNNIINETNLVVYRRLEKYYSLRNKLSSLNNSVFFVEKNEMKSFVEETISLGEELINLRTEKKLLESLYFSLLKTLNSRIINFNEHLFVEKDINEIVNKFDNDVNNELIKLSVNLSTLSNKIPSINETDSEQNTHSEENEKNLFSNIPLIIKIFLGIIILIILIILSFELLPSYRKVDFLCGIGFGKYAARIAEKIVLKHPYDYKAYLSLAKAFEKSGDYNSSINTYKNAMKIKEKNENLKDERL